MRAMRTAARMRAGGALLGLHVINAREPCAKALGVDPLGLVPVQGSVPCRVLGVPRPSTVTVNLARTGDNFSMILCHKGVHAAACGVLATLVTCQPSATCDTCVASQRGLVGMATKVILVELVWRAARSVNKLRALLLREFLHRKSGFGCATQGRASSASETLQTLQSSARRFEVFFAGFRCGICGIFGICGVVF